MGALPRILCVTIALAAAFTPAARAENAPAPPTLRLPPAEFLEPSYLLNALPAPDPNPTAFDANGPRDPNTVWLIFEASPTVHLFFWNELDAVVGGGRDGWAFVPSATLMTRVRFLRTASTPVRTPSYMLRFNLQLFLVDVPSDARSSVRVALRETVLAVHLGHHSNGQEFCAFARGHFDQDCPPFDARDPDWSRVNLIDGGFGTNYVRLALHRKWVTAVQRGYAAKSWAAGAYVEENVGLFGGLKGPHTDLYGRHRLRLEGERLALTDALGWRHVPGSAGHLRLSAAVELIGAAGPGVAPYRAWVEVSRNVLRLAGTGLFARLYSGQDYYNINYVNRIPWQVQVGILVDLAPPLFLGHRGP